MDHKFKESDKQKVIEFLNFTAKNAKFSDLNTLEIVEYYKLLSFMQQVLLPKVEANILEIHKIVEAPQEEIKEEKPEKAKKSK